MSDLADKSESDKCTGTCNSETITIPKTLKSELKPSDLKGKIFLLNDANVAFCQKEINNMGKISIQRHNFMRKNALFCCLLSIGIGLANDRFINNGLILSSDAHTYKLPSTYSYLKQSNLLSCDVYLLDLEENKFCIQSPGVL